VRQPWQVAPRSLGCTTRRLAPNDPFPREAVRDLLGITRALYRAGRAKESPDPSRMARLLEVGKQYRLTLDLGVKYEPDTMAGRAAKSWAEKATAALGAFLEEFDDAVAPAVKATAERLRRGR